MILFNHISCGIITATLFLSSCSYYERFDNDTDKLKEEIINQQPGTATTTLSELKSKYMVPEYLLHDNVDNEKYVGAFTSYQIPANANEIVNAVVLSSDVDGNTYKKLTVKDLSDGSSLDISVDVSGISADFQQGQKITVDFSGLHIGLYADMPTVGWEYFNGDANRMRWELGRLSYLTTQEHIRAYGLPDISLIEPELITIPEILALKDKIYGHLVTIKNVKFGYQKNQTSSKPFFESSSKTLLVNDTHDEIPFSFENQYNMPVSRALVDEAGNQIQVTTSSYAKFADTYLPEGIFDVIAIVGWYKDKANTDGNFQILIQRFSDIIRKSE